MFVVMKTDSYGCCGISFHRFEESEQAQGATNYDEVVINSEKVQTCGDGWSIGFVFPVSAS